MGHVTLSNEQFQELIARIGAVSLPTASDGNFSTCSSRFNGNKNSDVNAFIDAVETFKDCSKVSDVVR